MGYVSYLASVVHDYQASICVGFGELDVKHLRPAREITDLAVDWW